MAVSSDGKYDTDKDKFWCKFSNPGEKVQERDARFDALYETSAGEFYVYTHWTPGSQTGAAPKTTAPQTVSANDSFEPLGNAQAASAWIERRCQEQCGALGGECGRSD